MVVVVVVNSVSRSLPWTVARQAPLSMEFSRQESDNKKKKRILEWVAINNGGLLLSGHTTEELPEE